MSELSNLRAATTLPQLARLMDLKGETLSYALYWYRRDNPYQTFTIPKRSGGLRVIDAPNERLKMVQSKTADLLARIQADLEAQRTLKSRVLAHGFKEGFSIVTNASIHRNRRWVFNVDLKDFFPSINFGRIYGFLIKDRNFQLDPKIAAIIAQIACYRNSLPQGSPCSPVISNLVTHILDMKLNRLAHDLRCSYTRYADDLTFSTDERNFPEAIGRPIDEDREKWTAGYDLVRIIFRAGFKLNHDKTRLQRRNSRQDVTGLVVNTKVNVRHDYYRQARSMCHHLFNHGYAYVHNNTVPVDVRAIEGRLAFIHQIRDIKKLGTFKLDQPGLSALYGRFLDYREFYGNDKPTIICEGKTDNVYLKAAVKKLATKVPLLINKEDPSQLRVRFFNYGTRTALFQNLSGGGDEMMKLLREYRERIKRFKHGPQQPVLMVVDNDTGSKKIFAYLSEVSGTTVDGSAPYYHAFDNLYVVPIPKPAAVVSAAIEDLFDSALLTRTLDGRAFNPSNKKFDVSKFYGKNELATRIVAPERNLIDFSKFEILLKTFETVIAEYQKKLAAGAISTTSKMVA